MVIDRELQAKYRILRKKTKDDLCAMVMNRDAELSACREALETIRDNGKTCTKEMLAHIAEYALRGAVS